MMVWTRRFLSILLLLLFAMALVATSTAAIRAASPAIDMEVGYQLSPVSGMYTLTRVNYQWADWRRFDTQFWLLPEIGLVASQPTTGYAKLQVLADAPRFTLGTSAMIPMSAWQFRLRDTDVRVFIRFGF